MMSAYFLSIDPYGDAKQGDGEKCDDEMTTP